MIVIILAAGYATRLYPVTIDEPKPLLKINGKEIITYIIENLELINDNIIKEIFVVTNNKFIKKFVCWHQNLISKIKEKIEIINDNSNIENDKLGAIGDINFVINKKNFFDDYLIIAGDSYFDFKLSNFANFFLKNKNNCVCAQEVVIKEELKRFAVAKTRDDNLILNLEEKPKNPKSNLAVYACYIYNKESLNLIKKYLEEKNSPDAPGYFLQWLYKIKPVYVYKINKKFKFYDIGTLETYTRLKNSKNILK
jgi:glucose-1-phosphate thymidylyltransferase